MPTTDTDRSHEALSQDECRRLLGAAGIGRLAFTESALPAIRAVSYTLHDDAVLIPVAYDSRLAEAVRGAVVAFEADCYDTVARIGWTVTVIGPSRVLRGFSVQAPHADRCSIAVQLSLVHGWRTTLPA